MGGSSSGRIIIWYLNYVRCEPHKQFIGVNFFVFAQSSLLEKNDCAYLITSFFFHHSNQVGTSLILLNLELNFRTQLRHHYYNHIDLDIPQIYTLQRFK